MEQSANRQFIEFSLRQAHLLSKKTSIARYALRMIVRIAIIGPKCLKKGLYVYPGGYSVGGVAGDHVLLAPPYVVTRAELDRITEILDQAIDSINKTHGH